MKQLYLFLVLLFLMSTVSSCGHNPYKQHQKFKGNGSWYGNKNLGYTVPFPKEKQNSKKKYWVDLKKEDAADV